VEAQPVDDLVDRLALGTEGDPDQIEVLRGDTGDGGAVRLVVIGREELLRVEVRPDAPTQARS
jgi:hypothetical protein